MGWGRGRGYKGGGGGGEGGHTIKASINQAGVHTRRDSPDLSSRSGETTA